MALYIYTMPMCGACEEIKRYWKDQHKDFIERSGERLKNDPRIFDDIDKDAFMILQMQNQTFPVEVELEIESA
jgi:glutaredoxin